MISMHHEYLEEYRVNGEKGIVKKTIHPLYSIVSAEANNMKRYISGRKGMNNQKKPLK